MSCIGYTSGEYNKFKIPKNFEVGFIAATIWLN